MIRIIAGEFKGYKLKSGLDRSGFRPTKDRVKESLFSILGDLNGKRVLDLFAGSGSLGFEALSRGAEPITLVENNFKQKKILKENVEKLKAIEKVQIVSQNVIGFMKQCDTEFDLILADPPYQFRYLKEFVELLVAKFSNTLIVFETSVKYEIPEILLEKEPQIKTYGNTKLIIFRA